jgi:hypothetical protein
MVKSFMFMDNYKWLALKRKHFVENGSYAYKSWVKVTNS